MKLSLVQTCQVADKRPEPQVAASSVSGSHVEALNPSGVSVRDHGRTKKNRFVAVLEPENHTICNS